LEIEWNRLLNIIDVVVLGEGDDRVGWKIGRKGVSIKTLYNTMQNKPLARNFKHVWDLKLQVKI
jgi:hypothetical protein